MNPSIHPERGSVKFDFCEAASKFCQWVDLSLLLFTLIFYEKATNIRLIPRRLILKIM